MCDIREKARKGVRVHQVTGLKPFAPSAAVITCPKRIP